MISLGNLDVIYIFIFMLGLLQTWLLSISEQGLCLTHLSRMAAVSSQLSTAGFCEFLSSLERRFFADSYCFSDKAPVTKTLMVAVSGSHIATHIPSFAPFFRNVFTGCQGFHTRNIAKGTTDPRVEFISQDHSSQFTNLEQIAISES